MACLIVMVVRKLRGSFFFFWLLWGKNATGLVFFGPFLTNNGQMLFFSTLAAMLVYWRDLKSKQI